MLCFTQATAVCYCMRWILGGHFMAMAGAPETLFAKFTL